MANQLGEAVVPIRATLDKLDKDLAGARSKMEGVLGKISGSVKRLGTLALTGAAAGILTIGATTAATVPKLVDMGADANETASLLENSLGASVDGLNDRLGSFADQANRSFYELQTGSSTFVAMTRAMGATQDQAADLSGNFVEMATDLGSFFNVSTDNAILDLQGALAGSSETMQKYGIDVRETTLKQMALDQGLIQSASDTIPRLARAQLIQQAITEQASDAMGDAIRTSDSWQNTMRGLQGRLKDTATNIGRDLIPALTPFLDIVGDLAETALPILSDVLSTDIIPYIQTAGEVVQSFIGNMQEGMSPLDAFIASLEGLAPPGVIDFLVSLRDEVLPGLSTWFSENVQPVIDMTTEFVSWKDVMIALGIAVAAVVLPALYGVVTAAAPVIAIGLALVGVVALVRNAWENDWGGIQEKVTAVLDYLQPYWDQLKETLGEFWQELLPKLQEVWGTLVEVWQTELQPALSDLWSAVQDLAEAFGLSSGDTDLLQVALGLLKIILEGVLFYVDLLSPSIEIFAGMVKTGIDQVKMMVDLLTSMKRAANEAIEPFKALAGKVKDLIDQATSLPDWLIPGSPTPFERGLRGIGQAIKGMPNLEFNIPSLSPALAGATAGGGGEAGSAPGGPPPINIYDARDPEAVARAVEKVLKDFYGRARG